MNKLIDVLFHGTNIRRIFSSFQKYLVMSTLETLRFDNRAIRKLPIDPEERNYVRTVNNSCFSKISPSSVENPRVVAISECAMNLLDLSSDELKRKEFVEYFSGNRILPGSETAAHCYCGHQFGYFSGQLGDGAAIYLGEIINKKNERWELQLKGSGHTPYSRTADGRKVLRSSIREFLCSEAMYFLGIPTTRAGTCITSDSEVIRDIFYDGHPVKEKCSIVLRIAPTFLRFGSFEIFKTLDPVTGRVGPSVGRTDILHTLLNYVIETFFPEIHSSLEDNIEKYSAFFKEVVLRTARLVSSWQCVGFCHGVLNTDNMSILGLTLDYGPFGFLDMYDSNHICNASDDGGRYSFRNQPEICFWNLQKFAEAIQKALPLSVSLPLLKLYEDEYKRSYLHKMKLKLGVTKLDLKDDEELIRDLFNTMESTGADFTNTFCCLMSVDASDFNNIHSSFDKIVPNVVNQCYPLSVLVKSCKPDMNSEQLQRLMFLINSNPELLENLGRTGLAIKRLKQSIERINSLEKMTQEDKAKNDEMLWRNWLERYKARILKEMEACKSTLTDYNQERLNVMQNNNPRFILRNHVAQKAIEKAEQGDFSEVQRVLKLLEHPYDHSSDEMDLVGILDSVNLKTEESGPSTSTEKDASKEKLLKEFYSKSPDWAFSLRVT